MTDFFAQQSFSHRSSIDKYTGVESAAYLAAHDPIISGFNEHQCGSDPLCTEQPGQPCKWSNGTCLSISIKCENFNICGSMASHSSRSSNGCVRRVGTQPKVCKDANGTAGTMTTTFDCAMYLLIFVITPMLGALSDSVGRRPVLIGLSLVSILPTGFLCLYAFFPDFSLYPYIAVKGSLGFLVGSGTSIAYIADVVSPQHRAAATGLILAGLYIFVSSCSG